MFSTFSIQGGLFETSSQDDRKNFCEFHSKSLWLKGGREKEKKWTLNFEQASKRRKNQTGFIKKLLFRLLANVIKLFWTLV